VTFIALQRALVKWIGSVIACLIVIGMTGTIATWVYSARHNQGRNEETRASQEEFTDVEAFVLRASRDDLRSLSGRLRSEHVEQGSRYIRCHRDHSSFHLLCALREEFPGAYASIPNRSKVRIVCSALRHARFSYDWGTMYPPDQGSEGEGGEQIVEMGRPALAFLLPILDDRTSVTAAATGGMEPLETTYRYRRADYAYRFICLILKRETLFDPDPKVRDKRIEKLKEDPTLREAIEHD
jgi:hypothetical protein